MINNNYLVISYFAKPLNNPGLFFLGTSAPAEFYDLCHPHFIIVFAYNIL